MTEITSGAPIGTFRGIPCGRPKSREIFGFNTSDN